MQRPCRRTLWAPALPSHPPWARDALGSSSALPSTLGPGRSGLQLCPHVRPGPGLLGSSSALPSALGPGCWAPALPSRPPWARAAGLHWEGQGGAAVPDVAAASVLSWPCVLASSGHGRVAGMKDLQPSANLSGPTGQWG